MISRPDSTDPVTNSSTGPLVLVADTDATTRRARADALSRAGFSVSAPDNGPAALDTAVRDLPTVVLICDDGEERDSELLRRISSHACGTAMLTLRVGATAEAPSPIKADAWIRPDASLEELVAYTRVLARLSRAERRCQELERNQSAQPPSHLSPENQIPPFGKLRSSAAVRETGGTTGGHRPMAGYLPEALACDAARHLPCLYRRLVDLAPEAVGITFNNRLVYVNRGYVELLGAGTAEEILGRSPLDFIHPDYHAVVRERTRRILELGQAAQAVAERFVRVDGICVDVEVAAAPCETGRGRGILVFVRDITRRKQAEEALQRRESELRLIMDSAPALISYVDAEGRYRSVNRSYQRVFGIAPEDVQGRPVREVLGEAAWKIVQPYMQRALAGECVAYEQEIPYARGGRRWMSVSYTPDSDEAGKVRGLVAQVLDISGRKAAEAELLESEQRFRQIAETIDSVFWMMELRPERVLYVSPAFQRIWGRSPEDLYRNPRLWTESIHPEDRAAVEQAFENWVSAPGRGRYDVEFRILRPDGQVCWVRDRGAVIRNTQGEVHRLTGIAEDVTERRQLERALRASEEFKQGVLDSLPAHIAVLDAEGIIRAVNEPWRRFGREHGCDRSDHYEVGADYLEICRRGSASGDVLARKALRGIEAVLRGDRTRFSLEYPCPLMDEERWFLMHALRPAMEAGGVIVTHLDITAQKRVEKALRHSQADLEQAQMIGQIGSWRLDLRRNKLLWSAENHRIFGTPRGEPMTYDGFLGTVHPEDRERVDRAWTGALRGSRYDVEFRIIVGRRVKWVRERAELEFDPNGQVRGAFGTTQDITERKQTERQIAQLNQDLQRRIRELETVFATAPIGLAIAEDPEAERIRGNPAYQVMLGIPAAEDASRHADDAAPFKIFQDGRELAVHELPMQRAVRGQTVTGQIVDVVQADARTNTLYGSAAPLFDEQGQPRGAVGAFLDITALKRAEEALRASEERFRTMIQAVPSLTFEGDPQGNNTFASESWYSFTGMTAAETFGHGWLQALHPEDAPGVAKSWRAAMSHGTLYESRHRLKGENGAYRWFIARALPVRDVGGRIVKWAGSVTDIDDLVRTEAALAASEAHMRQLLEGLPQLVWTCEANGRCDYLSPQWLRYTGLPADAQLGRLWLRQVHRDDRLRALKQWREAASAGAMFEAELRIRRADGAYHWFQSRAVPLSDPQGGIVKWLGTHSDIEELKQAVHALREADSRKNEFLAMLSHELRNPLAPIRNATAVLRRLGPKTPELLAARDIIGRQVDHLALLIDDLLDVSRITHGQIALKRQRLSIADIVEQAIEASLPLIESRRHRVNVAMPPQPVYLEGDPIRLVQVVTNLLHNAAKYTEDNGDIRVKVECTGSTVLLRVADNGMGIPADLLPHVFDVFTQGTRTLDRAEGGLGLGLSLAQQLVELHGGSIEACSGGVGQGSEFIVRLPRLGSAPTSLPVEVPSASPTSSLQAEAKRILVVDDNRDAAQALALMLTLEGHHVLEANDGPSAIEMARVFRPQLVLLDIGLPGMDGFELAKHLRQCPEARDAVLVAVTGYAEPDILRRSREAGFSRHLVKPVETDELLEVVALGASQLPEGASGVPKSS